MKFQEMPYQRVDLEQVKEAFARLSEEFQQAESGEAQFAVHQRYYELSDQIGTMITLASIRHDGNTVDEFYDKEKTYNDEILPMLQEMDVAYKRLLYASPYRAFWEEKIGKPAFRNMELQLRAFDEKLIPFMQKENVLRSEYTKLIASAKIDWDGEILNLSLLRKHMTSPDRATRKRAYELHTKFCADNAAELDRIFDELVKCRTEQGRLLGYENYLPLAYDLRGRICYDRNDTECFREQVKAYIVPLAEELHERRRERLGLEKLSYIDELVNFPYGNPVPTGTAEEILASGQQMYAELSEETKEFFDFMMEGELFDVLGRKDKRAGGYMSYLPKYKAPFIFANFNGTNGDVDVITHECGHAFQGYIAGKDEIQEHNEIAMETAEVHSMSMEFFTEPYMERFFGERAADYVKLHLEEAITFLPYGCMVDDFQHIMYEQPELTPAERNAVWRKLERVYKPHLDYEDNAYLSAGGYWQRQLHIYQFPLYYIDYCLAQTCALQYKAWMETDYQAAWKSYLKFCKLSASGFFTDMLREVGLESPFAAGCMEKLAAKMRPLLGL